MQKENLDIRNEARRKGVPLWRCAMYLGISEPTIIRWLRVPLSAERERQIRGAIAALAEED